MATKDKVPVSERALFARVDRALRKDGEMLRRCREDTRWFAQLGHYYIVDTEFKTPVQKDIDLEHVARELEVLKDWECLCED